MASTSSDSSPVLSGLSSDLDKAFVKGGLADDFKHFLDESVSSTESDEDKFNLSKRSISVPRQKLESALGGKSWLKTKPDLKSKPQTDIGDRTSKPAESLSPLKAKVVIKSSESKAETEGIPRYSSDKSDEDDEISEEIEQTEEVRWPLERALSNITEVTEGTEETSENDPVKSSVSNEAYSEKFESSEDGGSGNEFDFEFGNVNSEGESVEAEMPVATMGKRKTTQNESQLSDISSYDDSFEKSAESESSDNYNANNVIPPRGEPSKLDIDSIKLETQSIQDKDIVSKPIKDKDIVSKPIKDKKIVSKLIKDEEIVSKPIKDEEIVSKPIKDEEIVSKPIKDEEIVSGSIKDKEIVSGSIKDKEIVSDSIKGKERDKASVVKSIRDRRSSAKPIREKERSIAKPMGHTERTITKPMGDTERTITKPIEIKETSIAKPFKDKTFSTSSPLKSSASLDIAKRNTNLKLIRSKSEDLFESKASTSAFDPKTRKTAKNTPSLDVGDKTPTSKRRPSPILTTNNFKAPEKFETTVFARLSAKPNSGATRTFNATDVSSLKEKEDKIRADLLVTQFQKLKRDHLHLESLMKGYEAENVKLNEEVKKLKVSSQNSQSTLLKEKRMSSFQLATLKEKVDLLESRKVEASKGDQRDLKTTPLRSFQDENNRLKAVLQETETSNQRMKEKIEKLTEENLKLKELEGSPNLLKLKLVHLEEQLALKQQVANRLEKEKEETNKRLLLYQNVRFSDGPLSALENDVKKLFSEFEKKDSTTKETLKSLRDHHSALKQAYSQVVSQLENQRIEVGFTEYSNKKVGCNVMLDNDNTRSVATQSGEPANHGSANITSRKMDEQLDDVLKNLKSSNWLENRYVDTEEFNFAQSLESEKMRRKMLEQRLSDTEKENVIVTKENRSLKAANDRLNQKIESVLHGKPDELFIFLVLEKKIEELEKMYDARDSELSGLRDQLEQYTPFRVDEELRQTRELVLDKDRQLERVRLELDSLIALLHQLVKK